MEADPRVMASSGRCLRSAPDGLSRPVEGARTRSASRHERGLDPSPVRLARRSTRVCVTLSSDEGSSDEDREEADAGGDGVDTGDPQAYMPKKFHGAFSSSRVMQVLNSFNAQKKEIVEEIGLGGLLSVRPGMHHSRHLVFWLLKKLDTNRMRIDLPGDTYIDLTDASVERVLGISSSGIAVYDGGKYVSKFVKSQLCLAFRNSVGDSLPTIRDAKRILRRTYENGMTASQKSTFMMACAAFCCAYMLGPVDRSVKVPHGLWQFISNPANLRQCNWARYVLSVIKQVAMQIQNNVLIHPASIKLGGCWLYLELLYLDTVDLGQYNTSLDVIPRVAAYNMYDVDDLIAMDQFDGRTFGSRPRRISELHPAGGGAQRQEPTTETVQTETGRGESAAAAGKSQDEGGQVVRNEANEGQHKERRPFEIHPGGGGTQRQEETTEEAGGGSTEDGGGRGVGNEANEGPQKEEVVGLIRKELSHFMRDFSGACEQLHADNHKLFAVQEDKIDRMVNEFQTSVSERLDNIARYISKLSTLSVNKGQHDLCEERKYATSGNADVHMELDGRQEQRVHHGAECSNRGDKESGLSQSAKQVSENKTEWATKGGKQHVAAGCATERSRACSAGPVDRVVGVERSGPLFDKTPAANTGVRGNKPLFDSTPIVDLWTYRSIEGTNLTDAMRNDGEKGGLIQYSVHGLGDKSGREGASTLLNASERKVRVKMSGKKRRQDDAREDPIVAGLNKSVLTKKVCTRRKLPQSEDGEGKPVLEKERLGDVSAVDHRGREKESEERTIPPSPFELKFKLPGHLRQIAYDKYKEIMGKSGAELQRVWLKLEHEKLIEITGAQLQCSFKDDANISAVVLSAIVRLLQQEDDTMYKKHQSREMHWRHFMAPEFSDMVLGTADLTLTIEVRDMFVGKHMGSVIEYSRMIMIPTRGGGYWCLYMWDMKTKIIHVFDPVCGSKDPEEMWAVHGGFIKKIGKALNACKMAFFRTCQVDFEAYPEEFLVIEQHPATSADSGIYIVHYMRWFDGQKITQPISKRAAKHLRRTLPYELLMMKGNKGRVPGDLIVTEDLGNT